MSTFIRDDDNVRKERWNVKYLYDLLLVFSFPRSPPPRTCTPRAAVTMGASKEEMARPAKKRGDVFARKIVAKSPRVNGAAYERDKLFECRDLVLQQGYSQADARKIIQTRYGQRIPKGTLSGYVKGMKRGDVRVVYDESSRPGTKTALSRRQEQQLYNLIFESCELGCPLTAWELRQRAEVIEGCDAVVEKSRACFRPEWAVG